MSEAQVNYDKNLFSGYCVREQQMKYPDPAMQAAIETLLLQTITQLLQQFDFVSYLSEERKKNVLKNLRCLKEQCEIVLQKNVES